jgi:beta-glucosidase
MKTTIALAFVGTVLSGCSTFAPTGSRDAALQPELGVRSATVLTVDGLRFRDLNRDGRLNPYEDWRLSAAMRADDLTARMTLNEKAGLLVHASPPTAGGVLRAAWDLSGVEAMIRDQNIRFFIHRVSGTDAGALAETNNAVQAMAEDSRLGIPLTISSDPRNHFQTTFGLSVAAGVFSQWPETTGFAAIGDVGLVRRFGQIASAEYRAIGVRMALSPMADLATEPRWPRVSGTFGDDPRMVSEMVGAYIEGFQGGTEGLGPQSVAAVVKHWAGYGAQPDGYDAHNPYGRNIVFPGGRFQDHVDAFDGAFRARVAGVMPTYAQPPEGLTIFGRQAERVGAGFSRQMLTELLREGRGFDGVILTDWKITDDCLEDCETGTLDYRRVGMPWGVEDLTKSERFAKALDAGVDQFGGVAETSVIIDLVVSGRIHEARIDQSVRRLLIQTFELGLFENPYVDPDAARRIVGSPDHREEALEAQRRSLVLLENHDNFLPLPSGGRKVWLWKVSPEEARARGFTVVEDPADADLALVRIAAPFTSRPGFFFGQRHHEGALDFPDDSADLQAIRRASAAVPTLVSVYLDRPAILTEIRPLATALIAEFGASDAAFFDFITGRARPQARLPFELPSSMAEVEAQAPDAASDTANPLYPRGAGRLRW